MVKKIVFSVGEVSGDLHASRVIRELFLKNPNLKIMGMGGEKMKAEGFELVEDITPISTVGIFEPLFYIRKIINALSVMKRLLKEQQPDLLVVVDNQGFNMMLLRYAKRLGIKTCYYISPQEWQWGTKKNGKKVLLHTDLLLAIFPEEFQFYKSLGGNVKFVGHPVFDSLRESNQKNVVRDSLNIPKEKKIVGVFPGSRLQEIKRIGPVLMSLLAELKYDESVQPVVSIALAKYESMLQDMADRAGARNVLFWKEDSRYLIQDSYCSVVTSGTVTLEHAIYGTPCIALYRFFSLTYLIIKLFFYKKLNRLTYMTLPNLLFKKEVIPEFLQGKANVEYIYPTLKTLLNNDFVYESMEESFKELKGQLATDNVALTVANEIYLMIKQ
ncbi:lipid-A-disaccharide synthase [Candidatus Marinamargulisbacteria bacterium SCGC AG-410-N11]|nr:lipid-A-disaccharide synthase [Candidatus Marinamargulisbacteria bacterium SCGC AG-410-N11]